MKVLKWAGAKWKHVKKIIDIIPEHKVYIEPFFGSGAVFFNKCECNNSILNDLDSNVVNLFRVIRHNAEELALAIELTPYSREEYLSCYDDNEYDSDIEKARKFLVRSNMARGVTQYYRPGWRFAGLKESLNKKARITREWNRLPESILEASQKLKDAEIENIDAIKLIKKYNHSDCLIYIDPPYLLSSKHHKYYNFEMSDAEHIELLETIREHQAKIIISGYDNDLYDKYLDGWEKISFKAVTEGATKKTECLWVNYL